MSRKNKYPVSPPHLAIRFLRWYCHPDLLDEVEGDLYELFQRRVEEQGLLKAKALYWLNVLMFLHPDYIRRRRDHYPVNHIAMFENYFKIALRSLQKQKLYSFINIGGLSVGLTCFILIFLYVQHELSYDRFYENADQIYRVYQRMEGNNYFDTDLFAYTTVGLAPALVEEFPEVTQATTIRDHTALLGYDENNYYENGLRADAHFFEVFPYPFVQGYPQTALERAKSMVITQSLAEKIFGDKDPIGQSLIYQNGDIFTVTGVIKDPPANSSLKFSFITAIRSSSAQYVREMNGDQWNNNDYYTFFTLAQGADPLTLQNKLPSILEKYIKRDENYPFQDIYLVQRISDLHLETNLNFDIGLKGNPKYVSLFSLIAVFVLLLACVNYMNLAIARSIKRASEVGLRKVVGAMRWQLIGQFIGESVLIVFLALSLALGLTYFLSPVFGYLLERPIELNLIENVFLLPGLLLLVVIVGVLSGSYPAFFMSSLRPVHALKGKIDGRFSGMKIQRWLIVGQYAVSIILIISSLVIYRQFQFIQDKELGYNKEHVVTISVLDRGLFERIEVLKNEWLSNPNIVSMTTAAELPANVTSGTMIRHVYENSDEDFNIYRARVGYGYLDVFGIELVAGRDFSPDIKSDAEEARLINETAAKALGWTPEEAIGKQIAYGDTEKTVIGVMKDFHMHSMHMEIAPLLLEMSNDYFAYIAVKVRPDNLEKTITSLEEGIKKYSPYPFDYQFLNERFDQLYQADLRFGEMFGFFTVLSILIASLGLFGLAAFTAEQRTKEIGIRKVLGASVHSIISLLSKNFLGMVALSFLLATPIALVLMHQWLEDFAYRINIEWWMLVLPGITALLIAIITVSFQSIKAAVANPVDSLRNE